MSHRIFFVGRAFAGALLLSCFATGASAIFDDGQRPTVDEAHGFLGGTFERYAVAYADQGAKRRAMTRAAYGGDGCISDLVARHDGRATRVNWTAVSAVTQVDANLVDLQGAGAHGNLRLRFPNERATRSAANAFELLRSACTPAEQTAGRF